MSSVFADKFLAHALIHGPQVFCNDRSRIRPHTIRMGVIGTPDDIVFANQVIHISYSGFRLALKADALSLVSSASQ